MYRVRILEAAGRDLERLDRSVARRIAERISWLAENMEQIQPETLKGSLAGFYKLRVGDYRVIYELLREERLILLHQIDHRSKIYRKR